MRPRSTEPPPQEELFQNRLENLLDQRHELVRLAALIDWDAFDRQWGEVFSDKRGALTSDLHPPDRGSSLPQTPLQTLR